MCSARPRVLMITLFLAVLIFSSLCCAYLKTKDQGPIPHSHPEVFEGGRVLCTECHEEPVSGTLKSPENFNHSTTFIQFHKEYAVFEGRLCLSCHLESFCTDCHTTKDELKPSQKHGDRADRVYPHRGDYLTQHKIDGKIMPEVCFRCHGRQNNAICAQCHR